MNTEEISQFATDSGLENKMNFAVVSHDQLKDIDIIKPAGIIVNTDKSGQTGEHWVCFYFRNEGPAEFFDSLGHSPDHYGVDFVNYLIMNGSDYIYNKKRLQNFDSTYCGQYCLYFLIQRANGFTFENFLNRFSSDYLMNDVHVCLALSEKLKHTLK